MKKKNPADKLVESCNQISQLLTDISEWYKEDRFCARITTRYGWEMKDGKATKGSVELCFRNRRVEISIEQHIVFSQFDDVFERGDWIMYMNDDLGKIAHALGRRVRAAKKINSIKEERKVREESEKQARLMGSDLFENWT